MADEDKVIIPEVVEVEPTGDDASEDFEEIEPVQVVNTLHGNCTLNDEVEEAICLALRSGNAVVTACGVAGVPPSTFYDWMRRGKKNPDSRYGQLAMKVFQAMSVAEATHVALVSRAAQKEWTAAAWMLERGHPERWGRKDRNESDGKANVKVVVQFDKDWNRKDVENE